MAVILRFVCVALMLAGWPAGAQTPLDRQRSDFPSDLSGAYCHVEAGVKVVDTSIPVDADFLTAMASFGVEVVARYYGYSEQALPPDVTLEQWRAAPPWRLGVQNRKLMTRDEVGLLKRFGMSSIAVFQYQSDRASTFANWARRAPADAARAIEQATDLGQPVGSTIYFGADGDFVHGYDRPCGDANAVRPNRCTYEITRYFEIVSQALKSAGYRTGVYGSGATCKLLTDAQLVAQCWLNASPGHTNRAFGETSRFTVLRQMLDLQKYVTPKPALPVRSTFDSSAAFDRAISRYSTRLKTHTESVARRDAALVRCTRDLDFNEIRAPDFGQFAYD